MVFQLSFLWYCSIKTVFRTRNPEMCVSRTCILGHITYYLSPIFFTKQPSRGHLKRSGDPNQFNSQNIFVLVLR